MLLLYENEMPATKSNKDGDNVVNNLLQLNR